MSLPRPRNFDDPRAWWSCRPELPWPIAFPADIARAFRRRGWPIWYCRHEQACAMQRRLRERASEAAAPARPRAAKARAESQGQLGLFGTEAA